MSCSTLMVRLRGPDRLVRRPDSSSCKADTRIARRLRLVVNCVCRSAIATFPRAGTSGLFVKVRRWSVTDVFGAKPSGSRVTDSSRPAFTIACLNAPVAPPAFNKLGVTRAATRPPPSAAGLSFSSASDMNSQVLSDCCGIPNRNSPDSRRRSTSGAELLQFIPQGASTMTKSAGIPANSSFARVSPIAIEASGTDSKRCWAVRAASWSISWPRYRTWTPADWSASTSMNPANPEPAAGSQISMDTRLWFRRLRHPTASALAKDKLVVWCGSHASRSKSSRSGYFVSSKMVLRAGCWFLKPDPPFHPGPRLLDGTTWQYRKSGAPVQGRS